jgi:hypothetical protein
MIVGVIALFVWQAVCNKKICDAAYEGILYQALVVFPIMVIFALIFQPCVGPLSSTPTPWGIIVFGTIFVLFGILLAINNCQYLTFPPEQWDFS